MGDPAYEERRKNEKDEREKRAQEAAERTARYELAEQVTHMLVVAMKDLLEG